MPKLELPRGGGAIRPTGQKVAAVAFTGSASVGLPIATSPGRAGTGPDLNLSYQSGAGNGPFGTGWLLVLEAVSRQTERELPQYADERESDTFVLAGVEDLVPLRDASGARVVRERDAHRVYPYRPRVENSFARIERWVRRADGDTHWRVLTKNNVTSHYGLTPQARVADPEDPTRVFTWLLERRVDDRGEVIDYEYKAETEQLTSDDPASAPVAEVNRAPVANRYLKRIRYGNQVPFVAADWHFQVVLDYGEHGGPDPATGRETATPDEQAEWTPRTDPFSSFRAGFDVRTRRLCRRVLMFHHFPAELGQDATLVRSTDFEYDDATHLAKLVRVTERWFEAHPEGGYTSATIPPTEFGYTRALVQTELHEVGDRELVSGVDGAEYQFLDLDGEGLPGVVARLADELHYQRPRGGGRFDALAVLATQTTTARLGGDGQLVDLDGDGRAELAHAGGYYPRALGSDGWATYTPFAATTTLDPVDRAVRQVDLDASGLPDLLASADDGFVWVPSLGVDGYGQPRLVAKPGDARSGPAVTFDDDTIFVADMTGDGLQDIVSIGDGAVHYWPNLGRGRFGRRVTMADAPRFAGGDEFDPRRLRLADIDGSGTTDVVYLDHRGARAWFNLSGNGFSDVVPLRPFPGVSATTVVDVVDLLGKGTACLVWSERAGWAAPEHTRYLDLMGDKPHLLTSVIDNTGHETRVRYEPSTVGYLRDRDAGTPWVTRLPFPVHVVSSVEHYDAVARRRFVERFSYHHGYFDAVEREFHGFARVERWDAESFDDDVSLFELDLFDTVETNLYQPPVHTRQWFHTGAYVGANRISRALADEYWAGDPQAWLLPDTVLAADLTPEETREAVRALRGVTLREEVYGLDGTEQAATPYAVTESTYAVRLLQARGPGRHAAFHVHDRESLSYHYERDGTDPRVSHSFALEVDAYGDVTRSATVAYPRRVVPADLPEQGLREVLVNEADFAALDGPVADPDRYRAGVVVAQRSLRALGLATPAPFGFAELRAAVAGAVRHAPEVTPPEDGSAHLVLLSAQRTFYYADDLSGPLPLGDCGTRALVVDRQAGAFSDGQLEAVFGSDVDDGLLSGEGGYIHDDGVWWTRSPRPEFDPDRFYVVTHVFDPFGNPPATVEYEPAALFAVRSTDPVGNTTEVEIDYRVLSGRMMTDPNGNRAGVTVDTRGVVVATFVAGPVGSGLGDTAADPTTVLSYDPFAWVDRREPTFVREQARETHGDPQTRWTEHITYYDGSGNVLLEKATAEPGDAPLRAPDGSLQLDEEGRPVLGPASPRWVGTGRIVLDNKGNTVRRYESYFSSTVAYESEAELREQGVSPELRYDPLGRLIRTDFPDGTLARVEHTPWLVRGFDPNDTVLESVWFADRIGGALGPREQRAAQLAQAHAGTPTTTHVDSLGRSIVIDEIADAGTLVVDRTRHRLDARGVVLDITDARGNTAQTRVPGMLGQPLLTHSPDTGWRRGLSDAIGAPLRAWNERGFLTRVTYDAAHRPVGQFVTPPGGIEMLVGRTDWGETEPSAQERGLRGRVARLLDGAGELTNGAYDFKGNLLRQTRRLVANEPESTAVESTVDWNVANVEAEAFTVESTYDAFGRIVDRLTPDGAVRHIVYNAAGLPASVSVQLSAGPIVVAVSTVEYDARGDRVRCEYGNGVTATYEYDPVTLRLARTLVIRASDSAVLRDQSYTYDPADNLVDIVDAAQPTVFFANTLVSADQQFEYDARYRLMLASGREHAAGHVQTDAASFEPLITIPFPNSAQALQRYVQRYEYDATDNLLSLAHTGGAEVRWRRCYQYAADGNRLLATGAAGEVALTDPCPVHHVFAPSLSQRYTHDAHGNMTAMPQAPLMVWDHADKLVATASQVRLDGGTPETTHYAYDGGGMRVRKSTRRSAGPGLVPTLRSERLYLGALEIYREYAGDGVSVVLERQTLHVVDDRGTVLTIDTRTIGVDESPAVSSRFEVSDHLGSTALELDDTGLVISHEEFHPYGTTAYLAGRSVAEVRLKRYRYTRRERDEETALAYHGARYYAPWLGRWTSADPAGLADGVNRYAYGRDNPVTLTDEAGTLACPPDDLTCEPDPAAETSYGTNCSDCNDPDAELPPENPASGTGVVRGRQPTHDAWGNPIDAPSFGEQAADVGAAIVEDVAENPETLLPVIGPARDAAESWEAFGQPGNSWDEDVSLGISVVANSLFVVTDAATLGTGELASGPLRAALRSTRRGATRTATKKTGGEAASQLAEAAPPPAVAPSEPRWRKPKPQGEIKNPAPPRGTPGNADVIAPQVLDELPVKTDLVVGEYRDASTMRRQGTGVSPEAAHGAPQSAMRTTTGYSSRAALTAMLPKRIHRAFDAGWKAATRRYWNRTGRRLIEAQRLLRIQLKTIDRMVARGLIDQNMGGALHFWLTADYYITQGLAPTQKLRLPYSR